MPETTGDTPIQKDVTVSSTAPTTLLDHAGLDVADLDAQVRFYREALRLDVEHHQDLPELRFTFVMLRAPAGWRLELFKREGAGPRVTPDDPDGQHDVLGFGHICLTVADVAAVHDRLVDHGASSRIAPGPSPVPGVDLAYLADPEGNLIELLSAH